MSKPQYWLPTFLPHAALLCWKCVRSQEVSQEPLVLALTSEGRFSVWVYSWLNSDFPRNTFLHCPFIYADTFSFFYLKLMSGRLKPWRDQSVTARAFSGGWKTANNWKIWNVSHIQSSYLEIALQAVWYVFWVYRQPHPIYLADILVLWVESLPPVTGFTLYETVLERTYSVICIFSTARFFMEINHLFIPDLNCWMQYQTCLRSESDEHSYTRKLVIIFLWRWCICHLSVICHT